MSTDFHPDLCRVARFTPRRLASSRSLPLLRALTAMLGRRDDLAGVASAWLGAGTLDLFYQEELLVAPKAHVSQSFFTSQCASLNMALTRTG